MKLLAMALFALMLAGPIASQYHPGLFFAG